MKYILAIESSCDESAVAVVRSDGLILSNIVSSQIDTHKEYGGVIPEIASRMHVETINIVIEKALSQAKLNIKEMSAIAVTYGPGLLGCLMIGMQAAKTLAYNYDLPLVAVNHMEGHIFGNFIIDETAGTANSSDYLSHIEYPFICLVVSGGHTQIVKAEADGRYITLGRTIDDAAGEAYDKVARLLQLGYPGGPLIDKLAKEGDENKIQFSKAVFKNKSPENEFGFSFSGIKTAVINYFRKNPKENPADIAASFQKTVVDSLVEKTIAAAKKNKINRVYLAGGVAANSKLRAELDEKCHKENIDFAYPPLKFCTDNAAMIGGAAIIKLKKSKFSDLGLKAEPGLKL